MGVRSFFSNLKQKSISLGHRANNTFNHVKTHARNVLPFARKIATFTAGANRFFNLPYVTEGSLAVIGGTIAAEKALDVAEDAQRQWGLPVHHVPNG